MKFNAGISVINLNITNFMLFWQIKPGQVEKCDSASDSINSDPAETFSPVHAKSTPRRIRFPVSGTSKFLGARLVVGKVGKDVFLRRTLAYGTTYGIGVFCLTEEGEQLRTTKRFWISFYRHIVSQAFEPKLTLQLQKQLQINSPRSLFT